MYYVPDYKLEPPVIKIFGHCAECGGEIYVGDTYYKLDCDLVHDDCLEEYFYDFRYIAGEE